MGYIRCPYQRGDQVLGANVVTQVVVGVIPSNGICKIADLGRVFLQIGESILLQPVHHKL